MSALRGCVLYFDCFAGVAGDMALGALLDLGVPEDAVRGELAKLPIAGWRLTRERVRRGALMGTKIRVLVEDEHEHEPAHDHDHPHPPDHAHDPRHRHHPHTHYRDIRALLTTALDGDVRDRALAIFDRIAAVEARLHGLPVEEVAFHEVGAIDSIVDIVGTAAALAWLRPSAIRSRALPLGGGSVDTAHGRLPVPAPATLELLAGAPVETGTASDGELTTPTGAAIIAAAAAGFGPLPPMRVVAVGWGAGDRELPDRPNLLRVVAGEPTPATVVDEPADAHVVLEANVDDMNPQLAEPLVEALFAAGALDVWLTPTLMKKGRPGLLLGALCETARRAEVTAALFAESTTLGVRWRPTARTVLPRRFVDVETPWGRVPVKVAGDGDAPLNAAPEYEVCRALAREHGVPVKQVIAAAVAALHRGRER
jgi:uncharacterized protein (TIGR00299 family) protein